MSSRLLLLLLVPMLWELVVTSRSNNAMMGDMVAKRLKELQRKAAPGSPE